jgi:hypothetical protein
VQTDVNTSKSVNKRFPCSNQSLLQSSRVSGVNIFIRRLFGVRCTKNEQARDYTDPILGHLGRFAQLENWMILDIAHRLQVPKLDGGHLASLASVARAFNDVPVSTNLRRALLRRQFNWQRPLSRPCSCGTLSRNIMMAAIVSAKSEDTSN